MKTVVFYISGHGFGHASRSIEAINHLLAATPDVRVIVRTSVTKWLFDLTVQAPATRVTYHACETDTGAVQLDSLHVDEAATVERAREFFATFPARVASEAAFLRNVNAVLVLADIPPLGIAAATHVGIPAVALSNFTWDWIYSAYNGAEDIVAHVRQAYAAAELALRLPMHGDFSAFSQVTDLPFIARHSTRDPGEVRRQLNLPADERVLLLSFGGYGIDQLDVDALQRLDSAVLLSGTQPVGRFRDGLGPRRVGNLHPLDERALYASGLRYEDVVSAADVVVSKPGYGIIAECIANDTALLYTSRGHFVEYDVLVREMPRYLRAAFMSHEEVYTGRWQRALHDLEAQPPPPPTRVDGAAVAAQLLLDRLGV